MYHKNNNRGIRRRFFFVQWALPPGIVSVFSRLRAATMDLGFAGIPSAQTGTNKLMSNHNSTRDTWPGYQLEWNTLDWDMIFSRKTKTTNAYKRIPGCSEEGWMTQRWKFFMRSWFWGLFVFCFNHQIQETNTSIRQHQFQYCNCFRFWRTLDMNKWNIKWTSAQTFGENPIENLPDHVKQIMTFMVPCV